MKKTLFFSMFFALVALVGFSSCKKDNNESGTAKVNIRLTDGPGDYDAVLIDVRQVEIHTNEYGWATLDLIRPGIYNLLDFKNGMDTLLCRAEIPAGKVSQMRLILGSNNTVVVDGVSNELSTPSAQQSGLKFNIHQDLLPNGSYDIWIDFDAGRSIVKKGSGGYSLKPVIRTFTQLTNGKIKGYVLPFEANAVVYAINGLDTACAIPNADGFFMFCGLPEGTYSIWFDALDETGYGDSFLPTVPATFGTVNDIGNIILVR